VKQIIIVPVEALDRRHFARRLQRPSFRSAFVWRATVSQKIDFLLIANSVAAVNGKLYVIRGWERAAQSEQPAHTPEAAGLQSGAGTKEDIGVSPFVSWPSPCFSCNVSGCGTFYPEGDILAVRKSV